MSALAAAATVGGLGLLFAGISGSRLVRARRLRGRGRPAEAVVVGQQAMAAPAGGDHAGQLQRPVLLFTTREGRTMQVVSPVGSDTSSLVPGHRVTIYYDPDDPTRFSVPDQELGVYRLLLAVGLFMLALVAGYAVVGERITDAAVGIPLFMGAVFSGIGWYGIGRVWRLKHSGRADGVVVGAVVARTRNGLPRHHPVVRYQGPDGSTIEVPSTEGHHRPPAPGTPVRVCFDRADPRRMVLAHQHAPAVFWVFGIGGLPLVLVGIAVLVVVLG